MASAKTEQVITGDAVLRAIADWQAARVVLDEASDREERAREELVRILHAIGLRGILL
jgi:hypothetical protein